MSRKLVKSKILKLVQSCCNFNSMMGLLCMPLLCRFSNRKCVSLYIYLLHLHCLRVYLKEQSPKGLKQVQKKKKKFSYNLSDCRGKHVSHNLELIDEF